MQYGVAGLGVAALKATVTSSLTHASAQVAESSVPATENHDQQLAALVAPLAIGSQVEGTTIAAMGVDKRRLAVITLTDSNGREWHAELARRAEHDHTHNPLAMSQNYSVYLRNGGSGSTPTDEHVARAVHAIANQVKQNERHVGLALPSRSEHWAAFGGLRA